MNKEAQEFLDEILAKDTNDINEEEAAFLRARESYLTSDQKAKFADHLKAPKTEKSEKAPKDDK
jgi:hypothetical protein